VSADAFGDLQISRNKTKMKISENFDLDLPSELDQAPALKAKLAALLSSLELTKQ
jgi:hypothetical protein